MSLRHLVRLLLAALTATACSVAPRSEPAIGEAYAGPATLHLRRDIDPRSPAVATVHFGEKLDIVAQKRRWYRVRTRAGLTGWTEDRALLDPAQMSRLRALARETASLPSQGAAKAFDVLNVHTEPNRQAPSFEQLKAGEPFEVVAHRVAAREPLPKRELVPPRTRPVKLAKKSRSWFPPPPAPAPPPPPPDWEKLSAERRPPPDPDAPPVRYDDWTLIRTPGGQSGWVLTSAIYMLIPDEVAQYAEGRRITSYFSLGRIQDGDLNKDIWLWTTSEKLGEDHDFDSFRVFVWSLRHHRYETAYIQRRLIGFFPVYAKTGEFSVCLENDAGRRTRKQFVMQGNLVRPAGEKPCELTADSDASREQLAQAVESRPAIPSPGRSGWMGRVESRVRGLFSK